MGNIPRKKIVKSMVAKMPTAEEAPDGPEFERWVVKNATHFTCAARIAPGRSPGVQYQKLYQAIEAKYKWDGQSFEITHGRKAMVYAVVGDGRQAMIAEKQYEEMLKLRGGA